MRKRTKPVTRKRKKMSEIEMTPELLKKGNGGVFEVRAPQGQGGGSLEIYIRHPVLAEIIKNMTPGNYKKDGYDKVYAPCFLTLPAATDRCITRPAIYGSTKNFVKGTDWSWDAPRAILISNPEKLIQGFSLTIELKAPVPQDQLRRFGKMFMDGCSDIISAARPFKMTWNMVETTAGRV